VADLRDRPARGDVATVQEVVDALLDLLRGGGEIGGWARHPVQGSLCERDLADSQPRRADQQPGEVEDLGVAAQSRVGLDRLAEDLLEPADVACQLGAVLLLDGEQEALVARIADLRGVGVAVGDELLGLAAVQALISRLQVDVLVLVAAVGVVVVVALVDRVVDATERVDRVLELGERGRDHVVDRQPRDLLDRVQERRRPVRVRRVEPVRVRRAVRLGDR
jgi:hypothetical protein